MRTPLRNPRSFRPEEPKSDDLRLGRKEDVVIQISRDAMRNAIDQFAPDGADKLAMVIIATSGMFADLVQVLPYAPALVGAINQQLATAGWQLVQVARN